MTPGAEPRLASEGADRESESADAIVGLRGQIRPPSRCARLTKEQLLKKAGAWGLTNRRGRPRTLQALGVVLRNQLYAGIVDAPEYGVRGSRDFEPLISEDLCDRVQSSLLAGRVPTDRRFTDQNGAARGAAPAFWSASLAPTSDVRPT